MARTVHLHVDDSEGLRQRIQEARTAARLSQRDLAFPGCTAVYISRIETGARIPSLQIVQELADRTGVSAHWLLTGEEDPVLETAREIVFEYLQGKEVPEKLIVRLDRLTLPDWYPTYRSWKELGSVEALYPKGIPNPVPAWVKRYHALTSRPLLQQV